MPTWQSRRAIADAWSASGRYAARPPIATERLSRLPDGRLLYELRHRWRDGTTHLGFEPLEFLEKLAALVPPPRFNLVRYHGVLAPAAIPALQITRGVYHQTGSAETVGH